MNSQRHARIKEIFLGAVERTGAQRDEYLAEACDEDPELRREVESLLAHHRAETILEDTRRGDVTTQEYVEGQHRRSGFREGRLASWSSIGIPKDPPIRRLLVSLAVALLLAAVGWWTYGSIHQALRTTRGEALQAVLNANVLALELWIESRKAEAKACSEDEQIRAVIVNLVSEVGNRSTTPEQLKASPERELLHELVDPYVDEGSSAGYFVVDRTGLILSSSSEEVIGKRLNARGMAVMTPVFEGDVVFTRPYPAGSLVNITHPIESLRPMSWVDAPIADENGDYVASIGLGNFADDNFCAILGVGDMGETGETYAFDENGLMLSESRFNEQLRDIGLIEDQDELHSMVAVQVRDPGVDLTRGQEAQRELAARPLTEMAALAIASREKNDRSAQQGLILDAYRDYRGVPVIGAWKWLPQYQMGVVTEMDVGEAYAPLRYLLLSYGVLFGLLAITAASALYSSFSAAGWRRRVEQAEEVGPYRLEEKLGEGGMGTVFLAKHAMLKRPAAIKLMKDDQVGPDSLSRFEREVQIASRLTHPNTIEIYDFGSTKSGGFFCAMEYVDGLTLYDLVSEYGPVSPERGVFILRQVCGSLAEAHGLDLIHRDIKPQNVMLCQRGGQYDFVKVLDFGLAKDINRARSDDVTKTMRIGGTPLYMSPERFMDPQNVDQRSDIYAIGAVGFYLLTGESHKGSTRHLAPTDSLTKALRTTNPNVFGIPVKLAEIIGSCLEHDPGDRPQTVEELDQLLSATELPSEWNFAEARQWWLQNVPTTDLE